MSVCHLPLVTTGLRLARIHAALYLEFLLVLRSIALFWEEVSRCPQELLPAFDPFGISNEAGPESHSAGGLPEHALCDDMDEPGTPLSGTKSVSKHKLGGRHRRTTSEPTPIDSWQLRSEWPQH